MTAGCKIEEGNLRFSARSAGNDDNSRWLIDVKRISDGHWLSPQMWFDHEPLEEEARAAAALWMDEHPRTIQNEPESTPCLACGVILKSDTDTEYQFDNALWIGFHGGYGMFTDEMEDFPTTGDDRWLHNDDGSFAFGDDGELQEDPDYVPLYRSKRVLSGRPDQEAVLCHECAHALCDAVPWINKLIDPIGSHAHAHPEPFNTLLAEGHPGWDLDRQRTEGDS